MAECMRCSKRLCRDDIGAYKKFVDRGSTTFLCKECLAERLGVSTALIEEKIAYFKEEGCCLFV